MPSLQSLIKAVGGIINKSIGLMVAIGLIVFFWGLARFIFKAGDEKAVEEGRNIMIWGTIALFVMVSVWGLVWFINNSLGIPQGGSI